MSRSEDCPVYPTVTFFVEHERNSPGSTAFSSRSVLETPTAAERVILAIKETALLHPALSSRFEQVREHDLSDPESWWTSNRVVPVELDQRLSILQLPKLSSNPSPPTLDGRPVSFELEMVDDKVSRIQMVALSAVMDGRSADVFWEDLRLLLAGCSPGPSSDPGALFKEWKALWNAGKWQRSQGYWDEQLLSFSPESLPDDHPSSIWPLAKVGWLHLASHGANVMQQLESGWGATSFAAYVKLLGLAAYDALGWQRLDFLTPYDNRADPRTSRTISHFTNMVMLCTSNEGMESSHQLTRQILLLARYGHYPSALHWAANPTFDDLIDRGPILVVRETWVPDSLNAERWLADYQPKRPPELGGFQYDIVFDLFRSKSNLSMRISYRANRVPAAAVDAISESIFCYLNGPVEYGM